MLHQASTYSRLRYAKSHYSILRYATALFRGAPIPRPNAVLYSIELNMVFIRSRVGKEALDLTDMGSYNVFINALI